MEQQHPIPQEISSYQFRLVGDMTLNQFFQLAGGLLVSLLFYASSLHPIIKWPFIVFFALLGTALAFLPFEDRPLSKWIVLFFKSIYSPTIFNWQGNSQEQYFLPDQSVSTTEALADKALEESSGNPIFKKFEDAEKAFLSKVGGLFSGNTQHQAPVQASTSPPSAQPQVVATTQTQQNNTAVPDVSSDKNSKQEGIKIPENNLIKYEKKEEEKVRPKLTVEEEGVPSSPQTTNIAPVVSSIQNNKVASKAIYTSEAAPPAPPTKPNTISGQVFGPDEKIVEAAILEIRDSAGRPARAVKTNKLGHFLIVTSLENGEYEIITEKDGMEFDTVKFTAAGEIIPPIAIKARKKVVAEEVSK